MDDVDPLVLTTYAGLLLRDLLDLFKGDAILAAAAYNGGPARPNLRYGAGVERAALHARRVLEQSAALKGEKVVNMTWMRAR
jgi:soluble lytic murein transglycosylase-like protein